MATTVEAKSRPQTTVPPAGPPWYQRHQRLLLVAAIIVAGLAVIGWFIIASGKRKEAFRRTLTTTLTKHRPDLSGGAGWRVNGARFFVIHLTRVEREALGPVFESSDGQRFVVASANTREAADRIAARAGPGAVVLAVQPRWSFPAHAWIAADPEFWKSNAVARPRRSSREFL